MFQCQQKYSSNCQEVLYNITFFWVNYITLLCTYRCETSFKFHN